MGFVLVVGIAWMLLTFSVALVIGRAIRVADQRPAAGIPDRLPAFVFETDAQPLVPQFTGGRQP